MANNRWIADSSVNERSVFRMSHIETEAIDVGAERAAKPIFDSETTSRRTKQRQYAVTIKARAREMWHVRPATGSKKRQSNVGMFIRLQDEVGLYRLIRPMIESQMIDAQVTAQDDLAGPWDVDAADHLEVMLEYQYQWRLYMAKPFKKDTRQADMRG